MKDFLLIFRSSGQPETQPSPEQLQARTESWMNWMGGIAAQNKLASSGSRLGMSEAKTVRANNVVTDGPYSEIKEFINGYIVVKTDTLEDAVEMAKGCPIVQGGGGSVEVRASVAMEDNN